MDYLIKDKYITYSILIIFVLIFSSCRMLKKVGYQADDTTYIESCRKEWTFNELKDTITIRLIMHDQKGRYDTSTWPNFFIGITNQQDTIGLIDDFTLKSYKKNELLSFAPYFYGTEHTEPFGLDPVFTIHRNNKKNKLYCSVKKIYYGKLIIAE